MTRRSMVANGGKAFPVWPGLVHMSLSAQPMLGRLVTALNMAANGPTRAGL
jgi:hypothetical protein